jgi:lipoprotein-anchoring transpeptidase ErfK/SrfK
MTPRFLGLIVAFGGLLAGSSLGPALANEVVPFSGYSAGTIVVKTNERLLYNPMGAAALLLTGRRYAIHGTNAPSSIGGFVSHGCIRMHNADVLDLYKRVAVGTTVVVDR